MNVDGRQLGALHDAIEGELERAYESILVEHRGGLGEELVHASAVARVACAALDPVATVAGAHLYTLIDPSVPDAGTAPPAQGQPARPPDDVVGDNVPTGPVSVPDPVLDVEADPGPASDVLPVPPAAAHLIDEILDLVIAHPRPMWNGWRAGLLRRHRVQRLSDLPLEQLAAVVANAHDFSRRIAERGAPSTATPTRTEQGARR